MGSGSRYAVHRRVIVALMESQGYLEASALAQASGVSASTIRKIISGARPTVSLDTLQSVAEALDVPARVLGLPISDMWTIGPNGPEPIITNQARKAREGQGRNACGNTRR